MFQKGNLDMAGCYHETTYVKLGNAFTCRLMSCGQGDEGML